MTRVRRVLAGGLALAAATLTTVSGIQSSDAAAHRPGPAAAGHRAAPPTTKLHLRIKGCDTCTLGLQTAIDGEQDVWTSKTQRVGSDHEAVFVVPTKRTHGLSFLLDAPWAGNTGARPNMVTRYPGLAVDAKVTKQQAASAKRAMGCWAGTDVDEIYLDFTVDRFQGKDVTGHTATFARSYATHGMNSWKPAVKAYRGTTGNQDAFYCKRPATAKLTFAVPNADGTKVSLINGASRVENTWESGEGTVTDGTVSFRVPRYETRGLTATVIAPWEGTTGYLTLVAFRYGGHQAGDAIDLGTARAASKASPCWAGTQQKSARIALTVKKERVDGTTGPTDGTIAFASVTQPWTPPMMKTGHGILGTQEVIACG